MPVTDKNLRPSDGPHDKAAPAKVRLEETQQNKIAFFEGGRGGEPFFTKKGSPPHILKKSSPRVVWIDTGRALAMAMVFHSHLAEGLFIRGYHWGLEEIRFNGCVCIQFFLFLSGYVSREPSARLGRHLQNQVARLLVPFYWFNLLGLILGLGVGLFYEGPLVMDKTHPVMLRLGAVFLGGLPAFNGTTWFLTCLFSLQMMLFFLAPRMHSPGRILFSALCFSLLGHAVAWLLLDPPAALKVVKYAWFAPSALVAGAFYQLGVFARRTELVERLAGTSPRALMLLLAGGVGLYFLSGSNESAYRGFWQAHHINNLNFGNYFLYYGASLSGIALALGISQLVPPLRILHTLGTHSLVLLGLAGLMHYFVNPGIFEMFFAHGMDLTRPVYNLLLILLATGQLLLCLPLLSPIHRHLTDLSGRVLGALRQGNPA